MATYAVGDIHGCYDEFQRLLTTVDFDPERDQLWHTGDLVNGGPDSLGILRWFVEHDDAVTTVLGNHDLHLLAVALGVRAKRHKDNFDDVLNAARATEFIDWLRTQPLMVRRDKWVMVHAGLLPHWTVNHGLERAHEIEELLTSSKPQQVLEVMYGNRPRREDDVTSVEERWRLTINAMTRMRVLDRDGGLDFDYKSLYEDLPQNKMAWFDAHQPAWADHRIICGHWSALGFRQNDRILALDTGCRWGNQLTAIRLDDEAIFQVEASTNGEMTAH